MVFSWFGQLWPGNVTIIGVKHLYQDVEESPFSPFHRGSMVVRFFNTELATWLMRCVNGVEVFYENFQTVKNMSPSFADNPGVGFKVLYLSRLQCEWVEHERGLPRFGDP